MKVYPFFGDKEIPGIIRFGGPGLGNLLFPYFRALILANQYSADLINPIWPTFKLGPILRNELDTRFYFGLFNSSSLSKRSKSFATIRKNRVSEELFHQAPHKYLSEDIVVFVHGLRNYFEDLKGHEESFYDHLLQIGSQFVKKKLNDFNPEVIGVHIRLGDYLKEHRIPIEWYKEQINQTRQISTYKNLPIVIFSDGKDSELAELLSLPDVHRIKEPDALSDILRLSQCRLIIGSNSTFSAWGAFLSKQPFVRPENFYLGRLRVDKHLQEVCSINDLK